MAILRAKARKKLKPNQFGLPGKRKYPVYDRPHAANAKARASQMEARGVISPSEKAEIDTRADKVLGKSKEHPMKKEAVKKKTVAKKGGKTHHKKEHLRHKKLAAHHTRMADHYARLADNDPDDKGAGKMPTMRRSGGSKQDMKPPVKKRRTNAGLNNSGWGGADNSWGTASREGV